MAERAPAPRRGADGNSLCLWGVTHRYTDPPPEASGAAEPPQQATHTAHTAQTNRQSKAGVDSLALCQERRALREAREYRIREAG